MYVSVRMQNSRVEPNPLFFILVFPTETKKLDWFILLDTKWNYLFQIRVQGTKKMNDWMHETDWGKETSILFCPGVRTTAEEVGDQEKI